MDISGVLAVVGSAIAMIGSIIALFLWNRSEANSDRRDLTKIILAIHEEIKDFHYRLLEIERNRSK